MGERESLRAFRPRYDFEANKWVPQCPYGDVCTGCDAAGRCSRSSSVCDCCERSDVAVTTFADEFGTTLCDDCVKACEGQVSYGSE